MPALAELEAAIASASSALVAFSGGVDSSLVAAAAARVLGERALAVTAVSPALATGELDGARHVAASVGIAHRAISTDELAREGYRRNAADRCYHCKSELYDRLADLAHSEGFAATFSGANVDDLGDWRPGLRAAAEHGVRHPLVEAGFRKQDVRRTAAELRIPSADKPAMPCLASRLPYGTEVDPATLAQIDRAESAIKALGYRDLRVRHLGALGRVELADDELARVRRSRDARTAILEAVVAAGYGDAAIDDEPLRSGSFTGIRPIPLSVT
jgi:pyridinium-3,5-biscarboxylic acid mononucleotide sulfurtransferase